MVFTTGHKCLSELEKCIFGGFSLCFEDMLKIEAMKNGMSF